ncbi:endothelin-converting enzyme 1 [Cryphonectria parasitica EP155]|uniref:Endothelin-converting enzyme 1 n=1 Tax=Cryphonectria parasitica (strain ATCC 38755 / EP155) TaxID=660469 RepID=A0A9P5CMG9_CRYP1|nr:endothelin-converting enzyme 1 [Cryphonectria parasitica EP155]KAF3763247.1 endothelin-converting enzyme 1 [Cryphonectria parasitica EP155]
MSNINPSSDDVPASERTPLLGRDGAADEEESHEHSRTERLTSWLAGHIANIILSLLLIFFIALFLVTFLARKEESDESPVVPNPGDEAKICTTAGCVLASATLLRSISPRYKELDPCEDFRAYACEGFDAIHEIREDQTSVGSLQVMSEEGQLILKRILESPAPQDTSLFWTASSPDQEIFAKLQDGYNACLNETLLRSIGSKPLLDLLKQVERLYPLHGSHEDQALTNTVQFLMSIGVRTPISLGVGADDKDPNANVVSLSPPYSFGLPSKQYYNKTEMVTAYKDTIGAVLQGLINEARKERAHDLVDFEAQMAAAAPDPEDLSDITKVYNPKTLDEADAYNPAISVKTLITGLADGYKPSKIIVASPDYLKSLSDILATQERDVLKAYLGWKVVQSYGTVVESDSVEPLRRFNNKLQGKEPDVKPERWRTCVSVVDSDLPWILSRFFVETAFSKEAKDLGDQIIHDIKDEFITKLKHSEWMTKTVRQLAIDKVNLIRQKIGYPTESPDVTDAEELQKYYSEVPVSSNTFFANRLASTKNDIKREWAQIDKPVDKAEWGMSAPTVNAYYNPPGNEIVFPAGIMQAPVFYDPSVPKYLSYGAFGAVAGHELSHAFDSSGRNYDQNGNYTDWWDNSTIDAFKTKTDCFVEQYSNYSIPTKDGPLHVNGKLTLGENIADAGGLTAAFQSWQQRDDEKADLQLPGLQHFTKEQVFFLAYGLTWCGKSREERSVQLIYTDPHSPSQYRIKGTTSNSREFREAFNCPVKEPTCELW